MCSADPKRWRKNAAHIQEYHILILIRYCKHRKLKERRGSQTQQCFNVLYQNDRPQPRRGFLHSIQEAIL